MVMGKGDHRYVLTVVVAMLVSTFCTMSSKALVSSVSFFFNTLILFFSEAFLDQQVSGRGVGE